MTNWITEARLAHQDALASKPLCFVCDKQHSDHGSYPTCATHPYSPDGRCGHVGTFADGRFTGLSCIGAECRNGCARARGVPASEKVQLPEKARAGIEVLHRVVESLLTTSRYVDEEGEATQALADLSDCIADPPFRIAGVNASAEAHQWEEADEPIQARAEVLSLIGLLAELDRMEQENKDDALGGYCGAKVADFKRRYREAIARNGGVQ